jgi:predicted nucleic acid-binding protein
LNILPVSGDLIIRAAEQGGQLGLKLLDAVQYVTALEAGCDVMVTADARFRSSRYIEVVGI